VDARVGAELHGDLAEAGVDGGDVGCAVLQETVSEATGGSADVEAETAGDSDRPVGERACQLEAAAADVLLFFAEQTDGGVLSDGGAGLVDFLVADEHAAGKDEGAGTGSAGDQRALDEKQIETHLCYLFGWNRFLFQEVPLNQQRNALVRTGMAGIC